MLKKKIKLIILVLCIFIMTLTSTNQSRASFEIKEANLYAKDKMVCLIYNGIYIKIEYVVYKKGGKEYPAYCINRERPGVTINDGGYTVEIEGLIENDLVRSAIINGYPYKTYKELNCANEKEAFCATKMAVYDMLYNYNWNDFTPIGEEGKRVFEAMKLISNNARKNNKKKPSSDIKIKPEQTQWNVDEKNTKYISKTYAISAEASITDYTISIDNKIAKVVDVNNNEKQTFKQNEKFKILLPIEKLDKDGNIKIKVKSAVETKPIFYGKSPSENLQNYAITAEIFEQGDGIYKEKYSKDETKLQIYKIDADTKEPLENFEFQILNEKNEILYKDLETDKDGKIEINHLTEGKYFLQEVNGKENYEIQKEKIEFNIKYSETTKLTVENKKKEEQRQEQKQKQEQEQKQEQKQKQEQEQKQEQNQNQNQEIIINNIEENVMYKLPRTGF